MLASNGERNGKVKYSVDGKAYYEEKARKGTGSAVTDTAQAAVWAAAAGKASRLLSSVV